MPYRTDLKRPDLKGQFPCSVCNKIFCHSSSLSRHRMQAHYKSYICTQCNQEIHSSETLRSHMYRFHQIQRMFMCRCCNWAFPDKTSLHIHMQSMQKSGKPGDVSVLARSSLDSKELMAAFEAERARSLRSSTNSSPDEEQTSRCESVSPLTNESNKEQRQYNKSNSDSDKHTRKGYLKNNKQKSADPIPNNQQYLNNNNRANNFTGIFPNHVEQPKQQGVDLHIPKLGVKMESETACAEGGNGAQLTTQQQQLMAASALLQQQQPTPLQQQWFSQLLANNPYFWPSASLDAKGIATAVHHQQQNVVPSINNKLLQTVYAAVASAAANNRATMEFQQQQQLRISQQQQMPPQKKLRKSEKSKANEVTNPTQFATSMDLSLQIPNHQNNNVTDTTIKIVQGVSPAMSDGSSGKLNSLISNLLSIRSAESRSGSPAGEEDCDGKFDSGDSLSERKNKRKLRTPTRAEMAEIIYDDEPEICGTMLSQCSTENLGPSIQRLMENQQYHKSGEQVDNQGNNQQPSPAVSDSQTSGSSGVHLDGELASPKKCFCQAKLFDSNERLKCVNRSKEIPHQNAKQIRLLTDRVALLAGSLQEEAHAKEELIRCAHLIAELCDQ